MSKTRSIPSSFTPHCPYSLLRSLPAHASHLPRSRVSRTWPRHRLIIPLMMPSLCELLTARFFCTTGRACWQLLRSGRFPGRTAGAHMASKVCQTAACSPYSSGAARIARPPLAAAWGQKRSCKWKGPSAKKVRNDLSRRTVLRSSLLIFSFAFNHACFPCCRHADGKAQW